MSLRELLEHAKGSCKRPGSSLLIAMHVLRVAGAIVGMTSIDGLAIAAEALAVMEVAVISGGQHSHPENPQGGCHYTADLRIFPE